MGCGTNIVALTTTDPGYKNDCILSGTITENLTLTSDNQYLRGGAFIGDDINETVFKIEAGTPFMVKTQLMVC